MQGKALILVSIGWAIVSLSRLSSAQEAKPPTAPQITEKQLEQWIKQFPAADTNKDGKLTREEAVAYWLELQKKKAETSKPAAATHADVKYGPARRNVLDVYLAKAEQPTPVLINFHGGGFVGGDKSAVTPEPYVRQGVTVVSANYRFVQGDAESAPYPAPMHDGVRVVQFVRSQAKEWNIDPERIALTGGSAGAIMAMWIAYHDELARPNSKDPVERQSSRVSCVLPIAGPTNLDPDYIRKHIGGNPVVHSSINPFFGVKKEDELKTPEKQKLVREASPMNLLTKDDPPTFQLYPSELSQTPLPADTDVSISIHHPKFGVLLKEQLDKLGIENDLAYTDDGRTKVEQTLAIQAFLKKHLVK